MADLERYSYSKLESFKECQYSYKLKYIDNKNNIGNAFSDYGGEMHSLLERCANGEINEWDLKDVFMWEIESCIDYEFPVLFGKDLKPIYINDSISFFNNFEGFYNKKILGVERHFEFTIDDWIFNGVIDLIYKDENGNLIIRDYKSKNKFKSKKEEREYLKQLYMYSLACKNIFGVYPDKLEFVLIRSGTSIKYDFDQSELEKTLQWAKDTVDEIRSTWDFIPKCRDVFRENKDTFFSKYLCNYRHICEFNDDYVL